MSNVRILIADDNVSMRTMLERFIGEIEKYDIDFAGNGTEALRFYRQSHHDLMILDNRMPGMDGTDILRELRDDPLLERTHVIMITGEVDARLVSMIRSERLKIDDLIVKPIDVARFTEKVAAVARVRRRNRTDGPILKEADPNPEVHLDKVTLSADVIDRGSIAILEFKGKLTATNRAVVSRIMKDLPLIFSKTVVIDINFVTEIDAFGCGTLAVMSGWLELNEKEAFLACDDCATKDRITSLGISRLIPAYQGGPDPFDIPEPSTSRPV